jgi:hypothetical protein
VSARHASFADALCAWCCAGAAVAFGAWCAFGSPPRPPDFAPALVAFGTALGIGLVAGLAIALALRLTGRVAEGTRAGAALAVGSLPLYLAAPAGLIGGAAPALAVALAAALAWREGRRPVRRVPAAMLVLLHAQGTLAGLYLAARLPDYLAGWPGTLASLRALPTLWLSP